MRVEREWLRELIFQEDTYRRFTQDSPILPEVWLLGGLEYCVDPTVRVDLLLTPHRERSAGELSVALRARLDLMRTRQVALLEKEERTERLITRPVWMLSVSQSSVAVSLTFEELIVAALPLTPWWRQTIEFWNGLPSEVSPPKKVRKFLPEAIAEEYWMRRIVGVVLMCSHIQSVPSPQPSPDDVWFAVGKNIGQTRATIGDFQEFSKIVRKSDDSRDSDTPAGAARALFLEGLRISRDVDQRRADTPMLWSISLNRPAGTSISKSVSCTKADAARLLFNVKCNELTWAIVDSGIDASHPAFQRKTEDPKLGSSTRGAVRAAFDFTRLRRLVTMDSHSETSPGEINLGPDQDLEAADRRFKRMRQRLRSGQALDWALLEPLLRVNDSAEYGLKNDHGTHVAGILGGNATDDDSRQGMCPDINLFDLRVLDDEGQGDEFSIIAALQFIRYLNATSDQPLIHGVNLSLSMIHDVENYACGRTPICDECERLVASGVVVVAAAGNRGYERLLTFTGERNAYQGISITDPGNAETVITVGATHRFQPHTYGVSYFSSRGPTGDGRLKPDVLAPGERVYSTTMNGHYIAKDGTSMAAPHVSGVAAMLMARHREFLGQPERVKRIIMSTATDLGREKYFQGSGMVDALRALQAV